MVVSRIFALAIGFAAVAAGAGTLPLWFSGRLDELAGRTVSVRMTVTPSAAGAAALSATVPDVVADAEGYYGFAAPLDLSDYLGATTDAWLNVTFDGLPGAASVTLPPQRVGYVPFVQHVRSAHRLAAATADGAAVTVTNVAAVGSLTVTGGVRVTGALVVTNAVSWANGVRELSIDALALGKGTTRMLEADSADETLACPSGESVSAAWQIAYDGLARLCATTETDGELLLEVTRTDANGREETLFDRAGCRTGGGADGVACALSFPVRCGDMIGLTAFNEGTGSACVTWRPLTFGLKTREEEP